jgi:phosphoadenosine phosphosulfate reductase
MLVTETLFGVEDKVQKAIDRIRNFEPPEGYYVAFSGGKDSQTVYHLCKEAGVKFDAHYHLTTVDPPELIQFIRRKYKDVEFTRPKKTMWNLIASKSRPPTRFVRYCCAELKEGGGENRLSITGVRWSESPRRKANHGMLETTGKNRILFNDNDDTRKMMDICLTKSKRVLNPIIDWEESDVWEYLNSRNFEHCLLYDEGFNRLGCIMCPLAGGPQMLKEAGRWPKYYENYKRAFQRMLQNRKEDDRYDWKTAQDVMNWWIYKSSSDPNQIELFNEES